MFYILGWILFGLIVGLLAKYSHPGDEPVGFLSTLAIGIVGSLLGGGFNYMVYGGFNYRPAGLLMSIIGGVVFCAFWRWFNLRNQ